MKIQASEDYLTEVFNYREFEKRLASLLRKQQKDTFHFSIALIDLDGFKRINDTQGYQVGDRVIKEYAQLIRSSIRSGDLLFRYKTGDEFVIIFPHTNEKGALSATERIRESIQNNVFHFEGQSYQLTASIGLTSIYNQEITKERLISRLEEALKEAKKEKNNVQQA